MPFFDISKTFAASLAIIGAALLAALAPLLSTSKCHVPGWEDHAYYLDRISSHDYLAGTYRSPRWAPLFGEHIAGPMTGAWLAGVLALHRARFHHRDPLQSWALRYALFTIAHSSVALAHPWLFYACPAHTDVIHQLFSLGVIVFYAVAQLILLRICLLRLRLVNAHTAHERARRLWLLGALATVFLVVSLLLMFLGVFPVYFLVISPALLAVVFVTFQVNAFRGLLDSSQHAASEARHSGFSLDDAESARAVAYVQAASALSTLLFLASFVYASAAPGWGPWIQQGVVALDIPSNALLAVLAAEVLHEPEGLRTSSTTASHRFKVVGNLVEQRRARLIRDKLIASIAAESGPALAVAALLEGVQADELVRHAMDRFRSIDWSRLVEHSHIITGGGLLQVMGAAGDDLYALSDACQLTGCDVFWSHSWSDNGGLKWEAASEWAVTFNQREGRWPHLWLDKVCIDQANISEVLRCLPVFLAGCNSLLVTSGFTYASRLWCALELFVYYSMAIEEEARTPPIVKLFGRNERAISQVRATWLCFEVAGCNCYLAEDKDRILEVIAQFPRGALGFNSYIRDLARSLLIMAADEDDDSEVWLQV